MLPNRGDFGDEVTWTLGYKSAWKAGMREWGAGAEAPEQVWVGVCRGAQGLEDGLRKHLGRGKDQPLE